MIRRKLWRRSPPGATKSLAREKSYLIQAAKSYETNANKSGSVLRKRR